MAPMARQRCLSRHGQIAAILCLVSSWPALAAAPPSPLPVPLIGQEAGKWCWAATTEMVHAYWKSVYADLVVDSQCEQATAWYGTGKPPGFDCNCTYCDPKKTVNPECDCGGGTPPLKDHFSFQPKTGSLSFSELDCQLNQRGRPVIFEWMWGGTGGGSHVMVAIGARQDTDKRQYVLMHNPLPVCKGNTCILDFTLYGEMIGPDLLVYWLHGIDYYDIVPKLKEQIEATVVCQPIKGTPPAPPIGPVYGAPLKSIEEYAKSEAERLLNGLRPSDRKALGLPELDASEGDTKPVVTLGPALEEWIVQLRAGSPPLGGSFPDIATLGSSLNYSVSLDGDPAAVLTLYPSAIGPAPAASWSGAKLCSGTDAQLLFTQRQALVGREKLEDPSDAGAIVVPLLNLQFLTFERKGQRMVVPFSGHPDPLPEAVPADSLLWKLLQQQAEKHNGLPS